MRWSRNPTQAPRGTESKLQAACEAQLGKLWTMRQIVDWYHRPDRKPGRGERSGLPDLLIAVRPGLVLAVELKTETGKVTPKQAAWLACWGDRGAVCRSVGELLDFVGRWV